MTVNMLIDSIYLYRFTFFHDQDTAQSLNTLKKENEKTHWAVEETNQKEIDILNSNRIIWWDCSWLEAWNATIFIKTQTKFMVRISFDMSSILSKKMKGETLYRSLMFELCLVIIIRKTTQIIFISFSLTKQNNRFCHRTSWPDVDFDAVRNNEWRSHGQHRRQWWSCHGSDNEFAGSGRRIRRTGRLHWLTMAITIDLFYSLKFG